jgi:carboxymethylenebutenolidase
MKRRDILLGVSGIATAGVVGHSTESVARFPNPVKPKPDPKPNTSNAKRIQITKDLPGYYVTPVGSGKFPVAIVLMEAFGLNKWCESVCDRLAKAGFAALAPDFYRGKTYAYTDISGAIEQLKSLKDDAIVADIGKSIDFLAGKNEIDANGIGVVGFCMGGRYAFLANASYPTKIKAAVSFYGGGIDAPPNNALGQKSLLDRVNTMQAPIMLIYGAEDQLIAAEEHGRIAAALSKAKKRYIVNLFPKAGHGFFSDRRDSYVAEAANEAWLMTTGFLSQNLKKKKQSKPPQI